MTLFEARQEVDSGEIYYSEAIVFEGHELLPELRSSLMEKSFELCTRFVENYPAVVSTRKEQVGEPSYYARRGPEDSLLNVNQPLVSHFNLLRTVDNQAYPAFFEHQGQRYRLAIEKADPLGTEGP